jgi:3-phenylpropionate/trans-cinnamate dioxygenase ferredoxin component
MAEYQTVGSVDDVPEGEMEVFVVGQTSVTVANIQGSFFAFDDTCTHRGCSLSEGSLEKHKVICPCHGSEFDVKSGRPVKPPATKPLPTYSVRVERDELQIAL